MSVLGRTSSTAYNMLFSSAAVRDFWRLTFSLWSSIPSRFINLLLLILVLTPTARADNSTCYHPNGSVAPKDEPCLPDQATSYCCAQGWTCLVNGMCGLTDNPFFYRGSCTDSTWISASCPQFCLGPGNSLSGGNLIVPCPTTNGITDLYSCAVNGVTNCQNDTFALAGSPATTSTVGVSELSSSISPSSASSSLADATNTASSTISPSSIPPVATATSASSASSAPGSTHSSSTHAIAIGLGIGLGVGIPAAAIIASLLYILYIGNAKKYAQQRAYHLTPPSHLYQPVLGEGGDHPAHHSAEVFPPQHLDASQYGYGHGYGAPMPELYAENASLWAHYQRKSARVAPAAELDEAHAPTTAAPASAR